jgi:hypothetical protein
VNYWVAQGLPQPFSGVTLIAHDQTLDENSRISGEIASGHGLPPKRAGKNEDSLPEGGLAGIEHLSVVRRLIQSGCPAS